METTKQIELNYAHPAPNTERESAIIARVELLDAKKAVAVLEKDDAGLAVIQAELDALCAEWDAGRSAAV